MQKSLAIASTDTKQLVNSWMPVASALSFPSQTWLCHCQGHFQPLPVTRCPGLQALGAASDSHFLLPLAQKIQVPFFFCLFSLGRNLNCALRFSHYPRSSFLMPGTWSLSGFSVGFPFLHHLCSIFHHHYFMIFPFIRKKNAVSLTDASRSFGTAGPTIPLYPDPMQA